MSYKISFTDAADDVDTQARIGGQALLPTTIEWPQNPNSEPLVLIASLPYTLLNTKLGYSLPKDTFISVFTTYNKNDYFLDVITYNGSREELDNIRNGYTKVIVHQAGAARNESEYIIPAQRIELTSMPAEEEVHYTASKLAGEPGWLQQEAISIPEYKYALQLYSSDFPTDFEDIFYLTDAVGYLFLSSNLSLSKEESGLFFVQTT